ncbi:RNA-binding protein [Clostridium cadaveris]|uniref:YlmH/Sll1252 family protein n=1 Tax=Clostridium cadaveris TaxID=1529 RepID=UPI001E4C1E2E|nr:YlmH/Sll1252 family protein [Clostridium cadaveris]UFH63482.1 RNA-binding protein [Clostridium cadaveris]
MNKNDFINIFNIEDKAYISTLYDKYILSPKIGACIYTNDFYPPNIWSKLDSREGFLEMKIKSLGGFNDSERRVIIFNYDDSMELPYTILKIKCKTKFYKPTHKDYLGAIMGLGIKREKFGDLIVVDDTGYIVTFNEIAKFISCNLNLIGKAPCIVENVLKEEDMPCISFEKQQKLTTSMRIDCVVSSLTGLSRGESEKYIKEGLVLLNYSVLREKSKVIDKDDVITIRRYGKFKIGDVIGKSSKGRIKFLSMKYT